MTMRGSTSVAVGSTSGGPLPAADSCRTVVTSVAAVLFYFVSSTCLTIFNKWFFGENHGDSRGGRATQPMPTNLTGGGGSVLAQHTSSSDEMSFRFPLTVTCIHQFLVFVLILVFEKNLLRRVAGEVKKDRKHVFSLGLIGALSGMDWGMSNTSLKTIPLSLYEMVKSCSPLCVLLLGAALGITRLTIPLVTVIGLLSVGMFLSVSGGDVSVFYASDFPLTGFILVALATVLSGIRVLLAQRALHGPGGSTGDTGVNSVTLLYYCTPASALFLIFPAIIVEGPTVVEHWSAMNSGQRWFVTYCILASSSLAFFLSFSEYIVTRLTSALTLCVTGITKQCAIVAIAMFLFHEHLKMNNALGFALTITGIALYNWLKWQQHVSQQAAAAASTSSSSSVLPPCSPVLEVQSPTSSTPMASGDEMKTINGKGGGPRSTLFGYQRVAGSDEEATKRE